MSKISVFWLIGSSHGDCEKITLTFSNWCF